MTVQPGLYFDLRNPAPWRSYLAGGRPTTVDVATAFAALAAPEPDGTPPVLQVITPAGAAGQLRSMYDGLPVDHVFFWASIAGMPDDLAEEHVRLVATELRDGLAAPTCGVSHHVDENRRSA